MAGLSRKFPDGIVYNVAAHINCLFKQIEATKHQHQRGFSALVPFLTFFFFSLCVFGAPWHSTITRDCGATEAKCWQLHHGSRVATLLANCNCINYKTGAPETVADFPPTQRYHKDIDGSPLNVGCSAGLEMHGIKDVKSGRRCRSPELQYTALISG